RTAHSTAATSSATSARRRTATPVATASRNARSDPSSDTRIATAAIGSGEDDLDIVHSLSNTCSSTRENPSCGVSSLKTSVTVLYQAIGDTSGGLGGDTSTARLGRWLPMNPPIEPRGRLAISQWPDDAPRGAVTMFCVEHDISRKSFYELRRR